LFEKLKGGIVVFAAHPDDDVIGCGGSLAKHASGHSTTVVFLTSGDAGNMTIPKKELGEIRETEAKAAASVLGVSDVVFLRNPDGFLECNRENVVKIANIIRDKKPACVYTHSAVDFHPDHRAAFELTTRASLAAGSFGFQELTGNPWAPRAVLSFEVMTPLQEPNYFEDISDYMAIKLEALRLHASQKALRCVDWVEGLNKYRGLPMGIGEYVEAFEIKRLVWGK